MKKVKMFSMVVLALAIIVVSYDSFAATQMQTVTADLPIAQGVYTTVSVYKNADSKQQYWNNATASNHDGKKRNLMVSITGNGDTTSWKSLDQDTIGNFSDSFVKVSGKSYKARLKNSGWSLYTYYTTGIWYVSV